MGYELRYADEANDAIADFALSFPNHLQIAVIDQIEAQLDRLAANPRIAGPPRGALGRPRFDFSIMVAGVSYRLFVVFNYTQDEAGLAITHFRRVLF